MPKRNPPPFESLAERAKARGINVPIVPSTERYLSPPDVARIMNVTPPTVFQWINKGRLPAVKTANGRWHVSVSDIEVFLMARNDNCKRCVLIAGVPADAMPDFAQVVEALGYQSLMPSNFTDAMLKAVNHRPALLIIFVGDGNPDPWKFAETIRKSKHSSWTPILVVSNSGLSEADTELAMKLSIQGFIKLPIENAILTAAVKQVLGR